MGYVTAESNNNTARSQHSVTADFATAPGIITELCDYRPDMFPLPQVWLHHYDIVYSYDVECQYLQDSESNCMLSYQLAVLDIRKMKYTERILFPVDGDRYSLGEIISTAVSAVGYGRSRAGGMRVLQIAHFGTMEWSAFRDRSKLRFFNLIHDVPVCRNKIIKVPFGEKHSAEVVFSAADTSLHAPAGCKSLKALSSMTTVKKVDIGKNITDMAYLLKSDKATFYHYAINDVRVTLEYEARFLVSVQEMLGYPCMPITLGALAVLAMDSILRRKQNIPITDTCNGDIKTNPLMLTTLGKQLSIRKSEKGIIFKSVKDMSSSAINKSFCQSAYIGGMNAGYTWGTVKCNDGEIVVDLDLCSAYPSSISSFADIDFNSSPETGHIPYPIRTVAKLEEALGMKLLDTLIHGYFQLSFAWDSDVKYPSIPCSDPDAGIIYPLEGKTCCTSSELISALTTGKCGVTIDQYVIFNDIKNQSTMAYVLKVLAQERRKYKKNTLGNLLYKECSNSLLGKLTQGIKDRKIYTMSDGGNKTLPESQITCPYIAADCTGLVRATLCTLVSIIGNYPRCRVLSVTTDGAMIVIPKPKDLEITTNEKGIVEVGRLSIYNLLPADLIKSLEDSYPVRMFKLGCEKLGYSTWIEAKHLGDEAGSYRTRSNWMKYLDVLQSKAAAAMQVSSADMMETIAMDDNISMLDSSRLAGIRDILDGKVSDIIMIVRKQTASLSPDGKRLITADGYDSAAPRTVDDARNVRDIVRNRRRQKLSTKPDMLALAQAAGGRLHVSKGASVSDICRKMAIRAIAHGTRAWKIYGMKKADIAKRLGLKDLKNATRQPMYFNLIPDTTASRDALTDICDKLGLKLTQAMLDEILYKTSG
jgi:hypothetical protein